MTDKRNQMKGRNEVKALQDKGQPKKATKQWADMTPQEKAAALKTIKPQGGEGMSLKHRTAGAVDALLFVTSVTCLCAQAAAFSDWTATAWTSLGVSVVAFVGAVALGTSLWRQS